MRFYCARKKLGLTRNPIPAVPLALRVSKYVVSLAAAVLILSRSTRMARIRTGSTLSSKRRLKKASLSLATDLCRLRPRA